MNFLNWLRGAAYVLLIVFLIFLIVAVAILWNTLNDKLILTRVSSVINTTDNELPKFFIKINDTLITTKSTLSNLNSTITQVNTDTLPRINETLNKVDATLPKLEAAVNPQAPRVSTSKTQVKPPSQPDVSGQSPPSI